MAGNKGIKRGAPNASSNIPDSIVGRNNISGNNGGVPSSEGSSRKRSNHRERNVPSPRNPSSQSNPVTESTKKQRIANDPMLSPANRDSALTQNVETPLASRKADPEDQNLDGDGGSGDEDGIQPTFSPNNQSDSEASEGTLERRLERDLRYRRGDPEEDFASGVTQTPTTATPSSVFIRATMAPMTATYPHGSNFAMEQRKGRQPFSRHVCATKAQPWRSSYALTPVPTV